MKQYLDLVNHVLYNGQLRADRTGVGTIGVFGYQMRFNLLDGFPAVTTKKLHLKSIIHELLWFLRGETNIAYLKEHGVKIWDEWALANGELGPVYGKMWRSWPSRKFVLKAGGLGLVDEPIDQIADLIKGLREKPFSRRHIISGWNPALLPDESKTHKENVEAGRQALPPCHTLFQFYVSEASLTERIYFIRHMSGINDPDGLIIDLMEFNNNRQHEILFTELETIGVPKNKLSCQLYQRSADIMLGVPFNIASYALLTMMVAQVTGFIYGDFVHTFGDAHIYTNHVEGAKVQLQRTPHILPQMKINYTGQEIDQFKFEDFELANYYHDDPIKFEIAV